MNAWLQLAAIAAASLAGITLYAFAMIALVEVGVRLGILSGGPP